MSDTISISDVLLLSPPVVSDAVHPDLAFVELGAFLRQSGRRVALKDLNAEFIYDFIYREEVFNRFQLILRELEKEVRLPPVFPGWMRFHGCLSEKPASKCGFGELEESAFACFAAHAYYLGRICKNFDIDCGHSISYEKVGAENKLIDSFYHDSLAEFTMCGYPRIVGIYICAAAQFQPAAQLASFIREQSPDSRILLSANCPEMPKKVKKEILSRFKSLDAIVHHANDFQFEIEKMLAGLSGPTKQKEAGIKAGVPAGQFEPCPADTSGFPLNLYPARLVPMRMGQRGDGASPHEPNSISPVAGGMKDQYAKTGYDSFIFTGAAASCETLDVVADDLLKSGFYVQWSAWCDIHGEWGAELCAKLFRSGCRYLFFSATTARWAETGAEKIVEICSRCAENGLRMNAVIELSEDDKPETLEGILKTITENHAAFNDFRVRMSQNGKGFASEKELIIDKNRISDKRWDMRKWDAADGGEAGRLVLKYTAKFARAKGEKARISGEFEIECAMRESPFRPAVARVSVALCYICLESEKPEHLNSPLSLMYLEAYARRNPAIADHFVFHRHIIHPSGGIEETVEKLLKQRPAVIGFSCYIWNIEKTKQLCARIKKVSPDTMVVLGGPEVMEPEPIFHDCPGVDYIVMGEGERPFTEILLSCKEGSLPEDIPGLAFKKNGLLVCPKTDYALTPIDDLPAVFTPENLRRASSDSPFYVETSRGCVNHCNYCAWTKKANLRNFRMERVENDLKTILLGRRSRSRLMVYFTDAQLNINLRRMKRILRIIIRNNRLQHTFETTINLRNLDEEAVALMRQAPFNHPYIGLESIHSDTLANAGRPSLNAPAVEASLGYLRDAGLLENTIASVIIGLPGDNYQKYFQTIQWCWDNDLYVYPFTLWVLPGTCFSREAERFGIVYDRRAPHSVSKTGTFSRREIRRAERFSLNYVVLHNFLGKSIVTFFKENRLDFPALAEGLNLGKDFYTPFHYLVMENADTFLESAADGALQSSLAAAVKKLKAPPELKEIINDIFSYRVMEYSLKRRISIREKEMPDTGRVSGRYVLGAHNRLRLLRDVRSIIRGETMEYQSIPNEPFEGLFGIGFRNKNVSMIEAPDIAVMSALLKQLDTGVGETIQGLLDHLSAISPGVSRQEIVNTVRQLEQRGVCLRT